MLAQGTGVTAVVPIAVPQRGRDRSYHPNFAFCSKKLTIAGYSLTLLSMEPEEL